MNRRLAARPCHHDAPSEQRASLEPSKVEPGHGAPLARMLDIDHGDLVPRLRQSGRHALRAHVAPVIILAALLFVIDLIVGLVLALPFLFVAAPFLLTQGPELLRGNVNVGVLLIAGCLLFIVGIVVNFLHGILNTFSSAAWTLAYREWLAQPAAPTVSVPAPAV